VIVVSDENYLYYLNSDLSAYLGQWIAIVDKKVVSSSFNAKEAYDAAKKAFPGKVPFLACVPKAATLIL